MTGTKPVVDHTPKQFGSYIDDMMMYFVFHVTRVLGGPEKQERNRLALLVV
jgi:hypothetical protein